MLFDPRSRRPPGRANPMQQILGGIGREQMGRPQMPQRRARPPQSRPTEALMMDGGPGAMSRPSEAPPTQLMMDGGGDASRQAATNQMLQAQAQMQQAQALQARAQQPNSAMSGGQPSMSQQTPDSPMAQAAQAQENANSASKPVADMGNTDALLKAQAQRMSSPSSGGFTGSEAPPQLMMDGGPTAPPQRAMEGGARGPGMFDAMGNPAQPQEAGGGQMFLGGGGVDESSPPLMPGTMQLGGGGIDESQPPSLGGSAGIGGMAPGGNPGITPGENPPTSLAFGDVLGGGGGGTRSPSAVPAFSPRTNDETNQLLSAMQQKQIKPGMGG